LRSQAEKNKTTLHLCGLSLPQVRQNHHKQDKTTVACRERKNNQPVWPVAAARRKNNQPVSRVVGLRERRKTICQQAGKKNYLCSQPQAEENKTTINMSPQAGEMNNQPVRPVQRQETKQKTINLLCGTTRQANKTMEACERGV